MRGRMTERLRTGTQPDRRFVPMLPATCGVSLSQKCPQSRVHRRSLRVKIPHISPSPPAFPRLADKVVLRQLCTEPVGHVWHQLLRPQHVGRHIAHVLQNDLTPMHPRVWTVISVVVADVEGRQSALLQPFCSPPAPGQPASHCACTRVPRYSIRSRLSWRSRACSHYEIRPGGPPWWGLEAMPAPPGHRCDQTSLP
eukprot:COSAG01_NODE_7841_length_3030_cov_1.921528_5_plen_196_part_01